MPSLFHNPFAGLFGGGSQKKETDAQAQTQDPNAVQTNEDRRGDSISVEEVVTAGTAGAAGSKRGRDTDGVEAQDKSRKVQRRLSHGLVADYGYPNPKDAVNLSVGSSGSTREYDVNADWKSSIQPKIQQASPAQTKAAMGGTRRGGFRPMDTLRKAAPQAAPRMNGRTMQQETKPTFYSNTYDGVKPNRQAASSQVIDGGRLSPSSDHQDRMQRAEARAQQARKQRTNGEIDSDPIEIDSGDEKANAQEANQKGHSRQTLPMTTQHRATSSTQRSQNFGSKRVDRGAKADPLGGGEFRRVQDALDGKPPAKQAASTFPENPYSLERSLDSRHNHERSHPFPGTKQDPFTLDDEVQEVTGFNSAHPSKRRRLNDTAQNSYGGTFLEQNVPLIELAKGVDAAGQEYLRQRKSPTKIVQGSPRDMHSIQSTFDQQAQRPSRGSMQNDGSFQSYVKNTTGSSQLRNQFTRDAAGPRNMQDRETNTQSTSNQKLRNKMQSKDALGRRVSPIHSDDELNGPKTIRSRDPSPQKSQPGVRRSANNSNRPQARRSASPGGLSPSNFTGSGHDKWQNGLARESSPLEDDSDTVRIPINAIFCKGFVAAQKDLSLLWDQNLTGFLVQAGKKNVLLPNSTHEVVTITSAAATIGWLSEQNDLRVILSGSQYPSSNGRILLEFPDEVARGECYCHLASLYDNGTIEMPKVGNLEKQWQHQKNLAIEGHDRFKRIAATASQRNPQRQIDSRPNRRHQRESSVEHIQYENGNATLAEELRDAAYQRSRQQAQEGTKSKYFDSQPRRSGRATRQVQRNDPTPPPPPVEKWTKTNKPEEWKIPVVYPTEGLRRVTLDFCDLEKLDDDECLNDNVVNFWLRHIEENMPQEHKDKVHFFNTYFYTSMSTKNGKSAFNYDAVKRWTKSVDIFSKPYVVVPINAAFHWFVVIICNLPNVKREMADLEDDGDDVDVREVRQEGERVNASRPPSSDGIEDEDRIAMSKDGTPIKHDTEVFTFDDEGKAGNVEEAPRNKKSKKKGPGMRKYDVAQPVLISMDSFGLARSAELKYLKQYLKSEAETKRAMQLDSKELQGVTAKNLPEQNNFTDCGIYLLAYIEHFCKNPERVTNKVLQRDMDIRNDFAGFDPSQKREEIRNVMLRLHAEQWAQRMANKRAKAAAKKNQAAHADGEQAATTKQEKQKSPTPEPAPENSEQIPAPESTEVEPGTNPVAASGEAEENDEMEVAMPHGLGQKGEASGQAFTSSPPRPDDKDETREMEGSDEDGEDTSDDEMLDDLPESAGSNEVESDEVAPEKNALLDEFEKAVNAERSSGPESSQQDSAQYVSSSTTAEAARDADEAEAPGTGASRTLGSPRVLISKDEINLITDEDAVQVKEPEIAESQDISF